MQKQPALSSFFIACLVGWAVLAPAGLLYARAKEIPMWAAVPLLAAFLIEFIFYLVPGFESVRVALISRFSRLLLALLLMGSALAPYVVYAVATGQFRLPNFILLAGIAGLASFWFVVFPGAMASDLGYIAMLAAIVLSRLLKSIYLSPIPHVPLDILGHIMLIRLGASAMILQRRYDGIRFGFIPSREEWLTGARFFLYFMPIAIPLGWALGIVRFTGHSRPLWQAVGIFFGILWVVALSEEFVFRGVLQRWIARSTGSPWTGLAVASVCFGLCHLPMRGFPNWRFATFSTVAGAFWGQAFQTGSSIRASMVAHALVVTAWMVWLS